MGTLLNQPAREFYNVSKRDVEIQIEGINDLAKKYKLSFDQVLEIYKLKETERRNTLFVSNGNILDEQLAGFGELLKEISDSLKNILPEHE